MKRRALLAVVMALVVVVAACSKDDNKKAKKATTATTVAAGALTLDQPMKIVLLAEKKGESSAAIPNFFDGASLALADLNAKGGVGGRPVDMKTIPAPLDPARAENALLQAFDEKPAGLI